MLELASGIVALVLTLALLSYLVADTNPLYRIAANLFVGLAAGYAVVLAWHTVIAPRLVSLLQLGNGNLLSLGLLTAAVGTVGGALLLLKTVRVAQPLGGLVVALMVGVGAAVAVGGALTGTLIPQTGAAMMTLTPVDANGNFLIEGAVEAVFTLLGTVATLGFFWYGGRAEPGSPVTRPPLARLVAAAGQFFITVAFGALYAGALAASVAIFADRMKAIADFVGTLM